MKIPHTSLDTARVHAAEMTAKKQDARFNAYKCPICPHFHVGRVRVNNRRLDDALHAELGGRAYGHWSVGDHAASITKRFRSAERIARRA